MQVWSVWHAVAENAGPKKVTKNRHLGTIAQFYRAVSLQPRHVLAIRKNMLSSNVSSRRSRNMVNIGPLTAEIRLVGLGHPIIFQRVSRLGSVTARQSSSGRQPNFAALNRGRHLCSAGPPWHWTLAHILVFVFYPSCFWTVKFVEMRLLLSHLNSEMI